MYLRWSWHLYSFHRLHLVQLPNTHSNCCPWQQLVKQWKIFFKIVALISSALIKTIYVSCIINLRLVLPYFAVANASGRHLSMNITHIKFTTSGLTTRDQGDRMPPLTAKKEKQLPKITRKREKSGKGGQIGKAKKRKVFFTFLPLLLGRAGYPTVNCIAHQTHKITKYTSSYCP